MRNPGRIVIVGATSSIAEHCARLWVRNRAVHLTLVGRDGARCERIATDLRVRSPGSSVHVVAADLLDPQSIRGVVDAVAGAAARDSAPLDLVLIAHGALPDQAQCERDLAATRAALEINAVSPALFAQAFAGALQAAGHGTLALIGSVAGDRGRKSNYVYGAAKGLLERFAQGLQHRLASSGARVVLIKPGPTDTPMTARLKDRGAKLAPVEDVARDIVAALARPSPVVYAPGRWRWIMLVLRHLPARVFNRLDI